MNLAGWLNADDRYLPAAERGGLSPLTLGVIYGDYPVDEAERYSRCAGS